jgi:hypothetical protein
MAYRTIAEKSIYYTALTISTVFLGAKMLLNDTGIISALATSVLLFLVISFFLSVFVFLYKWIVLHLFINNASHGPDVTSVWPFAMVPYILKSKVPNFKISLGELLWKSVYPLQQQVALIQLKDDYLFYPFTDTLADSVYSQPAAHRVNVNIITINRMRCHRETNFNSSFENWSSMVGMFDRDDEKIKPTEYRAVGTTHDHLLRVQYE